MSNHAFITPTRFVDLDADGSDSEATYGIRVSDGYAQTYVNGLTREEVVGLDLEAYLQLAAGIDDVAADIVRSARENGSISIGDVTHTLGPASPAP